MIFFFSRSKVYLRCNTGLVPRENLWKLKDGLYYCDVGPPPTSLTICLTARDTDRCKITFKVCAFRSPVFSPKTNYPAPIILFWFPARRRVVVVLWNRVEVGEIFFFFILNFIYNIYVACLWFDILSRARRTVWFLFLPK